MPNALEDLVLQLSTNTLYTIQGYMAEIQPGSPSSIKEYLFMTLQIVLLTFGPSDSRLAAISMCL